MCTVFDSISSDIDEVLSINPPASIFVFGDFNVHHKDWLTYSGGTDRTAELCYNFSISNHLTQMVNFLTRIPDCDSHSPALLDLFIFSDASICSTMTSRPLGNSDHAVVSVSIVLPLTSQRDAPFGRISLNLLPLLLLVNFVSGFRLQLMYISLMENIRSNLIHLHGFQLLVLLP